MRTHIETGRPPSGWWYFGALVDLVGSITCWVVAGYAFVKGDWVLFAVMLSVANVLDVDSLRKGVQDGSVTQIYKEGTG